MERLSKDVLKGLSQERQGPCITLSFSTQRTAVEEKHDRIKFDNLLRKTEEHLANEGMRPTDAAELLKPARALLNPINDFFWQLRSKGLVLFRSPALFRFFHLPYTVPDKFFVYDHFDLRPILRLFSGNNMFYLLALSLKGVNLYYGTSESIAAVDPVSLPDRLSRVLSSSVMQNAFPRTPSVSAAAVGREPPVLSQERTPSDEARYKIVLYFQELRTGIDELLASERVPLLLAGTDYLNSLYQSVNTYAHLIERYIVAEPHEVTLEELHRMAWSIIEPASEEARRIATERYRRCAGTEMTSRDIDAIVGASFSGRIDTLFVSLDAEQLGRFDQQTGAVIRETHTGDGVFDLFTLAAAQTFINGGTAYLLPPEKLPESGPVAALFRY